jgi:hypothetical protein
MRGDESRNGMVQEKSTGMHRWNLPRVEFRCSEFRYSGGVTRLSLAVGMADLFVRMGRNSP